MSLNVQTLISNCWPFLHATSASDAVFFTDAELTRSFADHLKRLAQNFGVFIVRDAVTVSLTQGQAVYDAPPRHLSTLHVAVGGKPLVAGSTAELELLSETYRTTEVVTGKTIRRFYEDKSGFNQIGFQPVPNAALAGEIAEVIFHRYPCNLDEQHTDVAIDAPKVVGDYLEAKVIGDEYSHESDLQMPEVAQVCKQLAALYEATWSQYFGSSQ